MEKSFWRSIVEADYNVPAGYTAQELTPELMAYLGSTDPELRDGFGYPILDAWVHRGLYSDDEKRGMMARLAENLMNGIGETNSDSVFLRAFSVLMLAELVHEDNQRHWLQEAEARQLLELALVYLEAERDVRGWVPEKGWAHSPAHAADLLFTLARNRYLGAAELERLLLAIQTKSLDPLALPYLYDEDERLAQPVVAALRRGLLSVEVLVSWLDGLIHPQGLPAWNESFLMGEWVVARHNVKLLLRSLYGQLTFTSAMPPGALEFLPHLAEAIKSLSEWYVHDE